MNSFFFSFFSSSLFLGLFLFLFSFLVPVPVPVPLRLRPLSLPLGSEKFPRLNRTDSTVIRKKNKLYYVCKYPQVGRVGQICSRPDKPGASAGRWALFLFIYLLQEDNLRPLACGGGYGRRISTRLSLSRMGCTNFRFLCMGKGPGDVIGEEAISRCSRISNIEQVHKVHKR